MHWATTAPYNEAFWLAVATAAPVLALSLSVVFLPTLRWTIGDSAKKPPGVWFRNLAYLLSVGSATILGGLGANFKMAIDSLAQGRDVLPPSEVGGELIPAFWGVLVVLLLTGALTFFGQSQRRQE